MARQARGRVRVVVEIDEIETDRGVASDEVVARHRLAYDWDFTTGTTDGTQIDRVWSTDAALTTTPEDSDLSGTSIQSVLNAGNTVSLADLVGVMIVNDDASGGDDINVGGGTNPVTAAADLLEVKPRGLLLWIAPYGSAIANASNDVLRMVAAANTAARRALVFGRSS